MRSRAGKNRFFAGKLRAVKTPVRMLGQLFIAFVGVVDGMKECFGVGDVNRDGNAEPSTFFPDGIKARIIHCDQFSGLVANVQAEIL